MTEVDPHTQALRDLIVADRDASIADARRRAEAAGARGDQWWRELYEERVNWLTAQRFSWEARESAT